jgi:hypothetical protein
MYQRALLIAALSAVSGLSALAPRGGLYSTIFQYESLRITLPLRNV